MNVFEAPPTYFYRRLIPKEMGSLYPWRRGAPFEMWDALRVLVARFAGFMLEALVNEARTENSEMDTWDRLLAIQVMENRRRLMQLEEELHTLHGGGQEQLTEKKRGTPWRESS